uniref:Golgi SNAP receptor complex member 1 n=1 Tax=Dracunculus medinensis TaxID=318479 RepID=A0A158Q5Y0_DRAME
LENLIDSKLVALNKLTASSIIWTSFYSFHLKPRNIVLEFKMSEHRDSSNYGGLSNPTLLHTLQRHREILRDCTAEFHRTHENIRTQLERESLLNNRNERSCILNNRVKASDLYLKEQEHISSCDRLLDEQISIAVSSKDYINNQGRSLREISKKMNALAKKYPMINSIAQKIQTKKRKDKIILAAVISICLILLFLYASNS